MDVFKKVGLALLVIMGLILYPLLQNSCPATVISEGISVQNSHRLRYRRDLPPGQVAWGDFAHNAMFNGFQYGFPADFSLRMLTPGFSAYYDSTYAALFGAVPDSCGKMDDLCISQTIHFLVSDANSATIVHKRPDYNPPFGEEVESLVFYYVACSSLNPRPEYCPSPCKSEPCANIPGTTADHECTSLGITVKDFKCECSTNFQWNGTKMTCARFDPCDLMYCDHGHCEAYPGDEGYGRCICDPWYQGHACTVFIPHWNPWQHWSPCQPECGTGRSRRRNRVCNSLVSIGTANGLSPHGARPLAAPMLTYPNHRGCKGGAQEYKLCRATICLVDGVWSAWSPWSSCSASCEGNKVRERSCVYNTTHGMRSWGAPCPGHATDMDTCNIHYACLPHALSRRSVSSTDWASDNDALVGESMNSTAPGSHNDTLYVDINDDIDISEIADEDVSDGLPVKVIIVIVLAVLVVLVCIVVLVIWVKRIRGSYGGQPDTGVPLAQPLNVEEGLKNDELALPTRGKKKYVKNKGQYQRIQSGYNSDDPYNKYR